MYCIYCSRVCTCLVSAHIFYSINFVLSLVLYPIFLKMKIAFGCYNSCLYTVISNRDNFCINCKFLAHPLCDIRQVLSILEHVSPQEMDCGISVTNVKPSLFSEHLHLT